MCVCIYVWIYIIYIYIRYSIAFSHYCFRQSNAKWMSERMSDSKMIEIYEVGMPVLIVLPRNYRILALYLRITLSLFFPHVTPTHAHTHTHTYIMHAYIYMHTYIHIAIRQYTQHDRQWDIFRWLYSRLWNRFIATSFFLLALRGSRPCVWLRRTWFSPI